MKNEQDAQIIPDQEPSAQPQDAVIEVDQVQAPQVDQAEAEVAAAFAGEDDDLSRQREQLRQSGYSAGDAEKEQ
ncbi:MAG: hypothetical protein AB7Q45_17655 [Planctomycetaceae bacterium]